MKIFSYRISLPLLLGFCGSLFFLVQQLTGTPASAPATALSTLAYIQDFDSVRHDSQGLRSRLRAVRVQGSAEDRQFLSRPEWYSPDSAGGYWRVSAQQGEIHEQTLRMHGAVRLQRTAENGVPLKAAGDSIEWRKGVPLRLQGTPANFLHDLPDPVRGSAATLFFDLHSRRLQLEGDALLERADGVLRSEVIEYFVDMSEDP